MLQSLDLHHNNFSIERAGKVRTVYVAIVYLEGAYDS